MTETSRPLLFAHRGSRLMAPENTLAAFEFAERHTADVLETDVRLSADGQVIVTHDATLERTTDGSGKVRDRTLAELRTLDAGFHFGQKEGYPWRGRGLTLLTLDELFVRFGHLGINIDIKDTDPAAATAVAGVIHRHLGARSHGTGPPEHRQQPGKRPLINVGSFHQPVIAAFRQQAVHVSTAAGQSEVARLYFSRWNPRSPAGDSSLPFNYLQIPRHWFGIPLARRGFIRSAHRRGLKVVYWTVDSPRVMADLLHRGADGIVTDRADLALPVFTQMGYR